MTDQPGELLRDHFSHSNARLGSNFQWVVMQRILALRVERARQKAILESALIAVIVLLIGSGLLAGYYWYFGLPTFTLPIPNKIALTAVGSLLIWFLLDAAWRARRTVG